MGKWITATASVLLALMLGWVWASNRAQVTPPPDPAGGVAAANSQPRARTDEPAVQRDDAASASRADTPARGLGTVQRGRLLTPEGSALPGLTLAWIDPRLPHRVGNRIVAGTTSVDLDHAGNRALLASEAGRRQLANTFGLAADAALAAIEGKPATGPRAVTDGLGRFELATEGAGGLVLQSDLHMLLGSGRLPNELETIHVAAPAIVVAGIVRDEGGAPLAGAHVSLGFRLDALPGLAARLQGADGFRSWNATSAADGTFSLGRVPVHAALAITAQKRGHESLTTPTTAIAAAVDWTLRTEAKRTPTLAGVVRHADGSPGAGARVDFGQDGGVCDAQGRFTFALTHWNDETRFTAWVAGHEPAVLDGLGARLRRDAKAGGELELWLGGAAKTIAGRVLAADGSPLRGVQLAVVDATQAGSSDQTLESLIGDQGPVVSDDEGHFELRGLSGRSYHVRGVQPDSLLVLEATNVAAGTRELELRTPRDAFVPRCEGQVVDQRGMPVANATVRLRAVLRRCGSFVKALNARAQAITDADGRFALADCPRCCVQWTIDGEGLTSTVADAPTDAGPVRLVVARLLKFRLVRSSSAHADADAFEVRDATGALLLTTERRPGMQSMHHRVPMRDAALYEVDERAAVLVLFAGDREIGRVPLQLGTDDVTDLAI